MLANEVMLMLPMQMLELSRSCHVIGNRLPNVHVIVREKTIGRRVRNGSVKNQGEKNEGYKNKIFL